MRGANPSRSPAEGSHSTGLHKRIIPPEWGLKNSWLVRNATTSALEATSRQKRTEGRLKRALAAAL